MYTYHPDPYPHPPHSGWPRSMYHYYRGPRRLLWFFLGGLSATLWLKGREKQRRAVEWPEERCHNWWSFSNKEDKSTERERAERWREERERMARIGSQATDTVADVSEAALESILTTVEMLKKKLSESRARHDLAEMRKEDSPVDSEHLRRV